MAKKAKTQFIVVYDSDDAVCAPLGIDAKCDGALCCSDRPAIFDCVSDARIAIRISIANYNLRTAQGLGANDDFSPEFRKNIKVLRCVPYVQEGE